MFLEQCDEENVVLLLNVACRDGSAGRALDVDEKILYMYLTDHT